jgi:hypothetical protein
MKAQMTSYGKKKNLSQTIIADSINKELEGRLVSL